MHDSIRELIINTPTSTLYYLHGHVKSTKFIQFVIIKEKKLYSTLPAKKLFIF